MISWLTNHILELFPITDNFFDLWMHISTIWVFEIRLNSPLVKELFVEWRMGFAMQQSLLDPYSEHDSLQSNIFEDYHECKFNID
jgi:hypothetical protein